MSRIDPDVCAGHGKPCVKKAATQTMFGCKKATFTESPPASPQAPPLAGNGWIFGAHS